MNAKLHVLFVLCKKSNNNFIRNHVHFLTSCVFIVLLRHICKINKICINHEENQLTMVIASPSPLKHISCFLLLTLMLLNELISCF